MRFVLCIAFAIGAVAAQPASAVVVDTLMPFNVPAMTDRELALSYTASAIYLLKKPDITDDLSPALMRQAIGIGTTLTDVWTMDVAMPLIAANLRSAQAN